MSFDVNRVQLEGNVTFKKELKQLQGGAALTFGVATSQTYNEKEYTDFHTIKVYEKQAEYLNQLIDKGNKMMVEGPLKTNVYEVDGQKRTESYVKGTRVNKIAFGEKKKPAPAPHAGPQDVSIDDVPF